MGLFMKSWNHEYVWMLYSQPHKSGLTIKAAQRTSRWKQVSVSVWYKLGFPPACGRKQPFEAEICFLPAPKVRLIAGNYEAVTFVFPLVFIGLHWFQLEQMTKLHLCLCTLHAGRIASIRRQKEV